jgi:hypothetical protein
MAGRRTNLALLVLMGAALLTGALSFGVGGSSGAWIIVAHGIVGLCIVVLAPWKSIIVRRGLGRRRSGTLTSIAFGIVVLVALVAGVLHSTGSFIAFRGLTAMQVHVGAALLSLPLGLAHVKARRVRAHRTDVARRQLLRSGVLVVGAGAGYLALEGTVRALGLLGGRRRFTGSHETGSFHPEAMPVTQWLNDQVPVIDPSLWRLQIVSPRASRSVSLDELEKDRVVVRAKIDCTGGWYAEQDWEGVALDRLLGPETADGRSVLVTSVSGYARRFPMRDAARLLLATRVGGTALSAGHGAPARLVAPGRRGFWWVKWVTRIEVGNETWWMQPPFPLT